MPNHLVDGIYESQKIYCATSNYTLALNVYAALISGIVARLFISPKVFVCLLLLRLLMPFVHAYC